MKLGSIKSIEKENYLEQNIAVTISTFIKFKMKKIKSKTPDFIQLVTISMKVIEKKNFQAVLNFLILFSRTQNKCFNK